MADARGGGGAGSDMLAGPRLKGTAFERTALEGTAPSSGSQAGVGAVSGSCSGSVSGSSTAAGGGSEATSACGGLVVRWNACCLALRGERDRLGRGGAGLILITLRGRAPPPPQYCSFHAAEITRPFHQNSASWPVLRGPGMGSVRSCGWSTILTEQRSLRCRCKDFSDPARAAPRAAGCGIGARCRA